MQFLTLFTVAIAAVVGTSAASINVNAQESTQHLQKRYDLRQLANFTGGDATAACNKWRCACINYVPKDSCGYHSSPDFA